MQFVWDIYDFVEQPLSLSEIMAVVVGYRFLSYTQTKTLPYNREENQTFKSLINFHQTNTDKAHCHMYKSFCSPQLRGFLCCRKIMSTCSLVSDELCRCYKIDIPTHNKNTHTKKFRSTFTEWKPWTSYILKNVEQQSFIPQHKRGNGSENGLFWSWLGLWTLCCYYHTVIVSRP